MVALLSRITMFRYSDCQITEVCYNALPKTPMADQSMLYGWPGMRSDHCWQTGTSAAGTFDHINCDARHILRPDRAVVGVVFDNQLKCAGAVMSSRPLPSLPSIWQRLTELWPMAVISAGIIISLFWAALLAWLIVCAFSSWV